MMERQRGGVPLQQTRRSSHASWCDARGAAAGCATVMWRSLHRQPRGSASVTRLPDQPGLLPNDYFTGVVMRPAEPQKDSR